MFVSPLQNIDYTAYLALLAITDLQQVYENGQVDLTNVLRKAGVLTTSHAVRITSAIADAVRIDTVRRRQDAVSRADSVRRGREDKATRKQRAMNYDATDETDGEDAPFKAPSFLALQGSPTYLWRAMGIEGHVLPMSLVFRRLNDELEDIYMCEEFVQPCEERDMRDKLDVLANLMMSLEILLTELGNFEYVFALRTFKGDVSYFGEQPVYLHTQLWSGYLATLPRQLWPESEDSRKDGVTPENASLALVIEIGSGTIKYRLARCVIYSMLYSMHARAAQLIYLPHNVGVSTPSTMVRVNESRWTRLSPIMQSKANGMSTMSRAGHFSRNSKPWFRIWRRPTTLHRK